MMSTGRGLQMPNNANFSVIQVNQYYNENTMQTLLQKESLLFKTTSNQTIDWDFSAALVDYFDFISEEGISLLTHLNKDVSERTKQEEVLEQMWTELDKDFHKTYKKLDKLVAKLKLQEDHTIKDRMSDYHSLLDYTQLSGGNRYDSIISEYSDVLRKLEQLGHNDEIRQFIAEPSHTKKEFSFFDIKLHQALKACKEATTEFQKADRMKLVGAFARLVRAYGKLKHKKADPISVELYKPDLERIHTSVVIHNQEQLQKQPIFSIEGDDIYHYRAGKIKYTKRANGKDPRFITLFKTILEYMPKEQIEIRVDEFNKKLGPKETNSGETYRTQLMKSNGSFMNLLHKQSIKNVHPEDGEPIIKVTNTTIRFNNLVVKE